MRKLIIPMAALALVACHKNDAGANDLAAANATLANEAMSNDVANAVAVTPAAFEIKGTSWEFTDKGKPMQESIDEAGNYVAVSGAEHIDHGTAQMVDGKACFTSAMDKKGPECWTTSPVEIGQSMDTTSDKGGKLTVKRVAYVAPVVAPAPAK